MTETLLGSGQDAPAFAVTAADGTQVALRELIADGPLVLVFIRSTMCTWCQSELDALAGKHADFESAKVRVAAAVCEDRGRAESWARDKNLPFPLLVDEDFALARDFGVTLVGPESFRMATPSVFIIDGRGVVRDSEQIQEDRPPSPEDYLGRATGIR